jgi:hypothetical protein
VPPFAGVAVNVTGVPWQNGLTEAVMETPAGNSLLTTIVIELDITTRLPLTQGALEVIWQFTTSPAIGVNIKVALLGPVFIPFIFQ